MADKRLSEVTKVKDMAYVPVILSDGSVGQIAKADLASVVAGVIGTVSPSNNGLMPAMGAATLSSVVIQSSSSYVEFSTTMSAGQKATFLIELSSVNNNSCALLIEVVSWSIDYVSNAICIGDNSLVTSCSYIWDGTNLKIYIKQKSSYARAAIKALSWNGTFQIASSIVESVPSGISTINIRNVNFGYNSLEELASGVAGVLPYNSRIGQYSENVNELYKSAGSGLSIWTITSSATNVPNEFAGLGGLLVNASRYLPSNTLNVVLQFFAGATDSEFVYYRLIHYIKSSDSETIHPWRKISYISD